MHETLDARIESRAMLDHPFYQRWTCGQLTREELQEYARQYYHYALAFPTFISNAHANCDDLAVRQLLRITPSSGSASVKRSGWTART